MPASNRASATSPLIVFDEPQVCASVVTTNEIKAAPVLVSAEHIGAAGDRMRAVVCNSGCANACTGDRGDRDARATARQAAALLEIHPTQVVVASTGVIGVTLVMDRIYRGLERCVSQLEDGGKAAQDAAEAIMTTDRVPKLSAYAFYDGDRKYVVGGIAKGSGMIAPNMATMLAFIASDYPIAQSGLDGALFDACDGSFNMISVDGDMSTNDAVYAFAPPGSERASPGFRAALDRVAGDLARAMVADGEGATKMVTRSSHVGRRRRASASGRASDRQQQSGKDGAVRRGSELGTDRCGGGFGAGGHRSGSLVDLRSTVARG